MPEILLSKDERNRVRGEKYKGRENTRGG